MESAVKHAPELFDPQASPRSARFEACFGKSPTEFVDIGKKVGHEYRGANPFPHIVIDGLLPASVLAKVIDEFPDPSSPAWDSHNHSRSKKLACEDYECWGPTTQALMQYLNGPTFLGFLEALTGIPSLVPDPYYWGGGLHFIKPGGFLGIHADFNWHDKLKLDRRLNALLYLNRNWKEEYGGHLELWDQKMKGRVKQIAPLFNRFVVFSTTDTSFHGHPDPLKCPAETGRKSLALYYYTNGRPKAECSTPHSTLYRRRSGEKNAGLIHPNVFFKFLPPIAYDALVLAKRLFEQKRP